MIVKKTHDGFIELVFTGYLDSNDLLGFKTEFLTGLTKPNCVLFNTIGVTGVDITLISDLVMFMNTHDNLIRNNLIASAILLSNSSTANLIRSALKTLFVIRKPTRPNLVSSDINDCIEYFKDNWELIKIRKN